ncbi:MAG: RNB domain-containing ribonuclease [Armatimonadetes bacterium]|nr:RNB domain-containing ribonuclease [Armatimonadota bacterium]
MSRATPKRIAGVTVDGIATRDRDDSIWMDTYRGRPRVWVGVTRVADAVPPGSDLDKMAAQRGFTRYHDGSSTPMLPRALTEEVLSLTPGRDQPVLVVRTVLGAQLEPARVEVFESVLRSRAAFSYPEAAAIIGGEQAHPAAKALQAMAPLAQALLARRREEGSLALYDLPHGWALTEEGQIERLRADERNIAYVIVQELMILANYALALWMVQQDLIGLFRSHRARLATPQRDALLGDIAVAVEHPELGQLRNVRRRVELLLERAEYAPVVHGHYALNLPCYAHATSPLRRRADLINQRVVLARLRGEAAPYSGEALAEIAAVINAQNAERQAARSAYLRAKALAVVSDLAAHGTADALAALDDASFFRALRSAAEQAEPTPAVAEAVGRRIAEDAIAPRQAMQVLLASPEAWAPLKRQVLAWLCRSPHLAVSVLVMAEQILGWEEADFRVAPHGRGFRCVARLRGHSATGWAPGKKLAQQQAALALCHLLAGEPPPPDGEPPAPELRSGGRSRRAIRRRLEAGDYPGALIEWCAQQCLETPEFAFRMDQNGGTTTHACRVTLLLDGATWAAEAAAASKRLARREAARLLIEQLGPRLDDACEE